MKILKWFEVALIGLGLSMDASALSMTNAMVCVKRSRLVLMAAVFAVFQAVMPLLGWLAGGIVSSLIERYGMLVAAAILLGVGIGMTRTGLCRDEICPLPPALTVRMLAVQGVATSIDAFAVGVGFRGMATGIVPASAMIGAVTFLVCLAAAAIGIRVGNRWGRRAQLGGGLLLIMLAALTII